MAEIFGSIEYYEKEMVNFITHNDSLNQEMSFIFSKLEREVLYDFVCDDLIREQCLNNLKQAFAKIKEATRVVL